MDTLTQITLGAACGEAVLGKKIGNRALAWGAFAGLIPDLDVAANLFTDEITAMAFHRGLMHSLPFAVVVALGMGWLVPWLYQHGHYRRKWFKVIIFSFLIFLLVTLVGAANYLLYSSQDGVNLPVAIGSALVLAGLPLWVWKRFFKIEWTGVTATRREWTLLFGWAMFTHVALDCFTSYGTQIFQPFTNHAVAFSSISVVDPLYTVPFLACLIAVLFLKKNARSRRVVNWLGIGISSAYLLFTVYHKWQVDHIFQNALAEKNISVERFTTSPTMFNNFLWQGMAEGEDGYYHAKFSLFDTPPYIEKFNVLQKNHDLIAPYENDETIQVLKWFSDGYFNLWELEDGKLQLNDLRYGSTEDDFKKKEDFIFRFILEEKNGEIIAHQKRAYHSVSWEGIKKLFERIKGG